MLKSAKDIYREFNEFNDYEYKFNEHLIELLLDNKVSKAAYLEYLEITQSDIGVCLFEALKEEVNAVKKAAGQADDGANDEE